MGELIQYFTKLPTSCGHGTKAQVRCEFDLELQSYDYICYNVLSRNKTSELSGKMLNGRFCCVHKATNLHLCMHGELVYHLNTLCCVACGLTQQTYNSVWTEQTKRAFDITSLSIVNSCSAL